MRSLGVEVVDFCEDCRSGLPLLRVEEHLRPGCVPWSQVYRKPTSIFHRVSNCNLAIELASSQLYLSLVGVGGKDIADGSLKLTLALVWQLMRFHVTQVRHRTASPQPLTPSVGTCWLRARPLVLPLSSASAEGEGEAVIRL